jgi:hypothetical protein
MTSSASRSYLLVKADVTDLLSQTGKFLADLTAEPSVVLGQQLNKSFQAHSSSKIKLENETIDCALMALTKSGELHKLARSPSPFPDTKCFFKTCEYLSANRGVRVLYDQNAFSAQRKRLMSQEREGSKSIDRLLGHV